MNRVLVTGGHSFIGSYVIDLLKEKGYEVVTIVRSSRPAEWLEGVEIYQGDVRDAALVHKVVEQVDGVIHLAAILGTKHVRNAWPWYENNVLGTINVLEACQEFNTPLTYIAVGNYWEHNNYSNSKVAAAREVIKYAKYAGVRANVVRALNAVGARQKVRNTGKIMSTFVTQALKNEPISVYGGRDNCSYMDLIWAGDVAKVLVDVLERTAQGEINAQTFEAGTGIAPSVYEIAERVIKLANSSSKIIEVPMRDGETPGSKVVAENPYPIEYRDIDDVILETIKYYEASPA